MPRQDVFSRRTDVFGGAFSADSAQISFPNVGGIDGQFTAEVGLLIQNLSMVYRQQVTRLYEVGTPAIYYVAGRTSGDGNISRVMGPKVITQAFYKKYGDACQAASNNLRFAAGTGCGASGALTNIGGQTGPSFTGGKVAFTAYFVVLTQIQISVNAENVVIGESLAYMFSSLDYEVENVNLTNQSINNNTAPGT